MLPYKAVCFAHMACEWLARATSAKCGWRDTWESKTTKRQRKKKHSLRAHGDVPDQVPIVHVTASQWLAEGCDAKEKSLRKRLAIIEYFESRPEFRDFLAAYPDRSVLPNPNAKSKRTWEKQCSNFEQILRIRRIERGVRNVE